MPPSPNIPLERPTSDVSVPGLTHPVRSERRKLNLVPAAALVGRHFQKSLLSLKGKNKLKFQSTVVLKCSAQDSYVAWQ